MKSLKIDFSSLIYVTVIDHFVILCVLQKLVTDWLHACHLKAFFNSINLFSAREDRSLLLNISFPAPIFSLFSQYAAVRKTSGSTTVY